MPHFDDYPKAQGLYNPNLEKDACGVGFVADLTGQPSRRTVVDALHVLNHLTHRGACGCEQETGDGAGILCSIPHTFFQKVCKAEMGLDLPEKGRYAAGIFFFEKGNDAKTAESKKMIDDIVKELGQKVLGWRKLPVRPTHNKGLGATALACEPYMEQLFIGASDDAKAEQFEAVLYMIRRKAAIAGRAKYGEKNFYVCSLSSNVITYKGMLKSEQVMEYFADLDDDDFHSHVALVHSRFATNTFPGWSRAHPYRYVCHNGEINTVCGNKNWQRAREGVISSPLMPQLQECCPIVDPEGSDSQAFDNVLEMLLLAGRTLPEACMMMMPEAWQNADLMDEDKKAFYKFNAALMEPWDGPALVCFTDGKYLGASLDRNGLRPCRYYVTKDQRVIGGSEVGVLNVDVENVVSKGRLMPGKMFLIDFAQNKMISDEEYKGQACKKQPYKQWIAEQQLVMSTIKAGAEIQIDKALELPMLRAFGYTQETLDMLLLPMGVDGMEGLGSMGNDVPLACLSRRSRTVFDYFKQLFAQVTNPPIDPIRESVVMTLEAWVGPERNILSQSAEHVNRLYLEHPVLTNQELAKIRDLDSKGMKTKVIDATYTVSEGPDALSTAIDRICSEASEAVKAGFAFIILSDRAICAARGYIPALMAVGAVHHHLVKNLLRTRVGLVSESGEPREVHHMCLMTGFGADAINPYMAYVALAKMKADNVSVPSGHTQDKLVANYIKSVGKGMLKVFAKMGVSTLMSYKGAQIFEALGMGPETVAKCFVGVASRIKGLDIATIAADYIAQHKKGFLDRECTDINLLALENPGEYAYRAAPGSEAHINDPGAIASMQDAARMNSKKAFSDFSKQHDEAIGRCTIRGHLEFAFDKTTPISIDEVEPAAAIVKRFRTGAMSYGSISMESHAALAVAMNRLGAKSNTGEGGEAPERFEKMPNGDSMRSSIKQVASGRFGVTINYLTNADELQIKMAQGAKPGEGGELPGNKVNKTIARCRNSTPGVGLISPPPHHDIYSIEDLAQLISDLKNANRGADVSVKLVSEVGVGVVAAGVAKAKADHILISGHDGGTGASRWTGIKHAGLPFELGIAETHQTLVLNGLRSRVSLETDGCLRTGRDVALAAALGAEMFGFATAPLIAMGCIMMRKCHLNVCPVGIATQDPELRKKFKGMPEHVVNFLWMVAEEVRETMASLGIKTVNELVGRSDLLMHDESLRNAKTKNLDLTPILTPAFKLPGLINPNAHTYNTQKQDHELEKHIDSTLILQAAKPALDHKKPVVIDSEIINIQRSAGTILSHEISKKYGEDGLPDDMITINFTGSSGQSAASFLTNGVTMNIIGDSNDGTAKGLCGGKVVVKPDPRNLERGYVAEDNIITGNVALYGATAGRAFFRGIAGERFAVRNSGAVTVVEGCGDHGLEYMTGGRCVIIGEVGKNFSAGMSGGIAWVYDPNGQLRYKANFAEPVRDFERLEGDAYEEELLGYLKEHVDATDSPVAKRIIDNWQTERDYFVQVYPLDYKRARKQAADADSWKGREEAPKQLSASELTSHAAQTATPTEQEVSTKFNKLRGFVEIERIPEPYREPEERLGDWGEIYTPVKAHDVERKRQSARCMDCGTPFCQTHSGCPIHNLMPEWNELVFKEQWKSALDRLLTTNNFPEFTGRVCPAPCEGACVAGLVAAPVTIKNIEYSIIDRGFQEGWVKARIPKERSGANIAVVGSGPAGLAAADELNQMGHKVTVFERDQKPGGLMMYGIPNMKLDKRVVQRRIELLQAEGVDFICGVEVGKGPVTAAALRAKFDAVLLATGAVIPRDLSIPGREAKNIHFAMDFLGKQQRALFNQNEGLMENAINFKTPFKGNKDWKLEFDGSFIDVRGQRVVVIGGGDTGTDCTATSIRQGCKSLVNLELMDKPPDSRDDIANAWPAYPRIFRTDYGQEEVKKRDGKDPRKYAVMTKEFIKDEAGNVTGVKIVSLKVERDANGKPSIAEIEGSEQLIEADTVILAMGFLGPDPNLTKDFGTAVTPQTNIKALHGSNGEGFVTSEPGVFAAGDCRRGQSLVVWAINEGQRAADAVNRYILESRAKQAIQAAADGVKSGRLGQRGFHTSAAPLPKEE